MKKLLPLFLAVTFLIVDTRSSFANSDSESLKPMPTKACANGGGQSFNNSSSIDLRVYRVKFTVSWWQFPLPFSVGSVCGNFKVTKISSWNNSFEVEPVNGYIDLAPNQQTSTGIVINGGLNQYDVDWRFHHISGPSSIYSIGSWLIGQRATGCSFSWYYKMNSTGSWVYGSGSNSYTKTMPSWANNFLLKAHYYCPGDSGVLYHTVHRAGNKVAKEPHRGLTFLNSSEQESSRESGNVTVSENYPNPFNPTTRIEFELFNEQDIDLSVYDLTGRKVETLISGVLGAGQHAATFDAADLPNGTYLYILTHEAGRVVNRMTLMK